MGEYAIAGVSVILLVVGIVEAAKRLGVTGNYSFALALGLGAGFGSLYMALSKGLIPAVFVPWIEVAVFGLSFSLAATGLYDLSRKFQTGQG